MPITKQARVIRQYRSELDGFNADVFVDLIESIIQESVVTPIIQVQFSLHFEVAQITGDSMEVTRLLAQVETDDKPYTFSVSIAANTNPRKQISLSVTFGQKLVTFQITNTTKTEADPILKKVLEALPESKNIIDNQKIPEQALDLNFRRDIYLPGAFSPTLIPEVSDRDVFVIMSFNRQYRDAFNLAIEPTLNKLGFKAIRVDQIQHNATVTPEIMRQIERSVFIVADLTGERPNVYYEVGYAHRADKEVILMAQKDSAVHFDVAAINRIEYEDYTELSSALEKRVRGIMENRELNLSPINRK